MAGAEEEEDYMGDLSQFLPPEVSQSSAKISETRFTSQSCFANVYSFFTVGTLEAVFLLFLCVCLKDDFFSLLFRFDLDDFIETTVTVKFEIGVGSGGKLVVSNSTSKKSKTQNWQEQRKLKRERRQIEEDMQTLENLGSAIPQSNIGFKLLKQMGYAPGSALGKEGSGRVEPVALEIRRGRAGIGKEDPKVEKMRREKGNEESLKRKEEELRKEFGSRQKERWRERRIVVNFRKAEASLVQLEKRDIVDVEKKEEEDEEKEEEEEEEEITEEDLLNILVKLRNEFYYCLFCGCQYETMEALASNCPGINEDDH
ncbi:hypothetical protein Sango_0861700 [Sesamum angolense]|uniref:G-patch domain-containing protein n=1 Tax=Sesamum angolense TaxID=2727404 RepID=A0AAE2C0W5_9LAMI|nr:hypothetical protein Sango_0861700 [Sesamum angolense]